MMTFEDISVAALARASGYGVPVSETRSLHYRRIGLRQQQIFAEAARLNPEFFGVCAVAPVIEGTVNLRTIEDPPVPLPELVTRFEVHEVAEPEDPESEEESPYPPGTEIHPIRVQDPSAALPPRATLRDGVLQGWQGELDTVARVKVYYSRLPAPGRPTDGDRQVEIPYPHEEILVVDLAAWLIQHSLAADPEVRSASLALLREEESVLLGEWAGYVATFVGSLQQRFG